MEALTLSSPMVIEVVGLPGSGKSFFATQFANTFGAAVVSYDKIRWTLFATHTYSSSENSVVKQVADMMITELFNTKKTFVLDGGYNDLASRRALRIEASKKGYRVLTIVVQTEEATAKRRATKRNPNRSGDIYKQSLTVEQWEKAKQSYQEPDVEKPEVVVISGKHNYSTQIKMVLRRMIDIADKPIVVPKNQNARRVTIKSQNHGTFVS